MPSINQLDGRLLFTNAGALIAYLENTKTGLNLQGGM